MAHQVFHTPLARSDLKELGRYIAQQSQSRTTALRFLDTIADKCQRYASQPLLGEKSMDLGQEIRRFSVSNYVVFYRPLSDGIEVLRVLHGNRDIPAVWRERFT